MKKVFAIVLSLVFIFLLASCGQQSTNNNPSQNANPITDNTADTTQAPVDSRISVSLNEQFTVGEVMTITLTSCEWCEEILPSNTNGVYSYLSDNDGEKYFVVRGEIKNLAGEVLDITYCGEAEVLINGKYRVPANMDAEDVDGNSFYGSVKSLQTLPLIVYASVSDELYNSCENVELTLNLINTEENVGYFYSDEYSHDSYVISFEK